LDFGRIVDTFDRNQVSFVSVTQQFNTGTSMGRLMLNVLLSFAQFEREIISERTRDKIAAARSKGKFVGGRPSLGYDLVSSPSGSRLVVNEEEAIQVRRIFALYLQHESLIPTVKAIEELGWTTKRWASKDGIAQGGKPFDKTTLFRFLTNVVYIGKVQYRNEVYPGEHAAIIDETTWQRVQAILKRNGRSGGALVRNRYGALLRGLIRCVPCDCAMSHAFTTRGSKRYRYYVCGRAQKRGWNACPSKSVPAAEIEKFVVEQIKAIGKDPAVLAATVQQARKQKKAELAGLQAEERAVRRRLTRDNAELARLAADATQANQIAALHDRIRTAEQRLTEIQEQMEAARRDVINERDFETALSAFDPVWETLSPREQARIVRLLIEHVDYDGKNGKVAVTFRPGGIKAVAQQMEEEAA
jgi:site-specific DNA recombinase